MIYAVPSTAMKDLLETYPNVIATDEAEAVALACGHYLATGQEATVAIGDNGLLNALDAIITLSHLHEIPINLEIYTRMDEPQHRMVTEGLGKVLNTYSIVAYVHSS